MHNEKNQMQGRLELVKEYGRLIKGAYLRGGSYFIIGRRNLKIDSLKYIRKNDNLIFFVYRTENKIRRRQ